MGIHSSWGTRNECRPNPHYPKNLLRQFVALKFGLSCLGSVKRPSKNTLLKTAQKQPRGVIFENVEVICCLARLLLNLEGRNRAIVIAESLARVIAAIRIASARWQSYLPPQNAEISPHRPCVRCAAARIARLAFIRLTFVPHGIAEWLARVDRVH